MTGQKSNIHNDIIIKSVKPRYININEDIFNSLSPRALKIYLALRFEADYSSKNSCVNKKIQFLINKTKISRSNVFESLNELEKFGLLLREQNKGYQSTFWIAQDLNYFNENKSAPVQNTDYPIQNTDDPVQNTDYIINNTFTKENYIHNSLYSGKDKKLYTDEFESFWNLSNKRGEKVKAFAAWKSHNLDGKAELLIELLQSNYGLKFGDREKKYQPHISTWINYRPWEEGSVKTEEEIIAKAQEQLQSTKNNLPAQINNIEPILSDLQRFRNATFTCGIKIKNNLIEAFLDALNARNIPIYQTNLEIIIEELQKIKFEGLDVNECIKKFLLSSWKSFSADYFLRKKAKRESLSNPFALHNQL